MHVIAAKAVSFKEALAPGFNEYQGHIVKNARTLAQVLMDKGYELVSGGTDTHLILVDLTKKEITGKEAEEALVKAGITVNKNTIPFETRSPFVTSGIRIGVPAVTTRGMKEKEMRLIGDLIDRGIQNRENEALLSKIKAEVKELCDSFPFYRGRLKR
jgi:glycine hydroxymethyltransferase